MSCLPVSLCQTYIAVDGKLCNTGRFRITRSADGLVQLLHQAARDAAASHSPALAQTLIAAVTDVADLAANLPPKAHAKQMQVSRKLFAPHTPIQPSSPYKYRAPP